jgi:hypothetical protein
MRRLCLEWAAFEKPRIASQTLQALGGGICRELKSFLEFEDERIRVDAMKYLADRLFGKAALLD